MKLINMLCFSQEQTEAIEFGYGREIGSRTQSCQVCGVLGADSEGAEKCFWWGKKEEFEQ